MALLITSIVILILSNSYVSYRVLKSDSFEAFQKVTQLLIVWLIPIIGAIVVFAFISSDEKPNRPRNPNDGQGHDSCIGGTE